MAATHYLTTLVTAGIDHGHEDHQSEKADTESCQPQGVIVREEQRHHKPAHEKEGKQQPDPPGCSSPRSWTVGHGSRSDRPFAGARPSFWVANSLSSHCVACHSPAIR